MDSAFAGEIGVMNVTINLAKDFSLYPMGRNSDDGTDNGERFFLEFLLPHLQNNRHVEVILDGVHALGSSFLDECFYEMPKRHGMHKTTIKNGVKITANSSAYVFYKKMADNFIEKLPS